MNIERGKTHNDKVKEKEKGGRERYRDLDSERPKERHMKKDTYR